MTSTGNLIAEGTSNGKYDKAVISVSAPYTKRDLIALRLMRDVSADTSTKAFYLLGVELRFVADGPTEAGKTFNVPPLNNDGSDNSGTTIW